MAAESASPSGADPASISGIIHLGMPVAIDKYKLIRVLGLGGMGVVYLAARSEPAQHVAIKVIKPELARPEILLHFRRERQILASLNHPNICGLLDGGTTEDGLPYLVMEYIEGVSVDRYCDKNSLQVVERLKIFEQICAAVSFAHRNLIVHLDLKPRNVLVTANGVPMLLDFGVAKLLNPALMAEEPTNPAPLAITWEYASPEQVRSIKDFETVATPSDVYSLGVILYELLAGHCPYRLTTHTSEEVKKAILDGDRDKPSTAVGRTEEEVTVDGRVQITPERVGQARRVTPEKLRRELSGDLDSIVFMAMHREIDRRYPSVEALSQDIQRYLGGFPVKARNGSLVYRARKFVRRNAVGVAAAAAFVLLLLSFAVTMTIQKTRLAREQATTQKFANFLVDMFGLEDPSEAKGKTVTAEDILDLGYQRTAELKDNPWLEAKLLNTIGNAYENLDFFPKAEASFRRALATLIGAVGKKDLRVAGITNNLANVLAAEGNNTEAEALYRESLAIRRELLGNEDRQVAESLNNLAGVLMERGAYQEAESLYDQALSMERKILREDDPDISMTENSLACVIGNEGNYAEAEKLFRRSLAEERRHLGDKHPQIALTLNNLGHVLDYEGDYKGAEAHFGKALELRRKVLPPESPEVAESLSGLGEALTDEGNPGPAESLLRKSLEIQRKTLRKDHPDMAETESALAACLIRLGQYGEAEPLLKHGYPILKSVRSDRYPETQKACRHLVELYAAWGQPGKAAPCPVASATAGPH